MQQINIAIDVGDGIKDDEMVVVTVSKDLKRKDIIELIDKTLMNSIRGTIINLRKEIKKCTRQKS